MAQVREKRPQSFKQFVAIVEQQQSKAKSLWFRGCGKAAHKLLPSLYRHRTRRTVADCELLERQLVIRFRQRSLPFLNRPLLDEWDTLFFMQHYGIPTRLLDWTENPFIAFFFATTSGPFAAKRHTDTISFSSDAAVWILDPVAWNNHALEHQGYDKGVLTAGDDALNAYKPLTRFAEMNILPVALYGAHNSPRIVAQRGSFTIFGQRNDPMDTVHETHSFPVGCLTKVILERDVLPAMRSSILNHGITEAVVFPDLEGLAREMKREFHFTE